MERKRRFHLYFGMKSCYITCKIKRKNWRSSKEVVITIKIIDV